MPQADTLDASLKDWLIKVNELAAAQESRGVELTPGSVRGNFAAMTQTFVRRGPELPWVGDAKVEGEAHPIPVRIYDPAPESEKSVCLFFHGGGHLAGSIDVYDPICRRLARASGQLLVSVEYRRAPEYPYPLGLNDCLDVARQLWPLLTQEQRRVRRQLFIAGDSGGGAYAASVSAVAQDDPELAIEKQVLIYPGLDYTLVSPSVAENGKGYLLENPRIEWYFNHYFQNGEDRHTVSPLHMPMTARLPQTLVITAGFCPLRDEGIAYAEKLRAAGVTCEHQHFEDMIHAYLNLENLVPDACAQTYNVIGQFLGG